LPIVLIALLIVTVLGSAIARSVISQIQHAHRLERQQQAAWLADSGVQRASDRLATDAGYEGETWRIESADSGLDAAAVVIIQVDEAGEPEGDRRVTVQASYPADSQRRVVQWRELTMRPSVAEASE
jgi:type II secretory pathway pseudopilin PulG